jgi:hypothetical protein
VDRGSSKVRRLRRVELHDQQTKGPEEHERFVDALLRYAYDTNRPLTDGLCALPSKSSTAATSERLTSCTFSINVQLDIVGKLTRHPLFL